MMCSQRTNAAGSTLTVIGLAFLVLISWTSISKAQATDRTEIVVRISVPAILSVQPYPAEVLFTTDQILAGEQDDGSFLVVKDRAIALTTTANVPHILFISTDTETWIGDHGSIPVSRLQWRTEGQEWTPLSQALWPIRDAADSVRDTIIVDLRLHLLFTDPPGTYAGDILFTIQAREN